MIKREYDLDRPRNLWELIDLRFWHIIVVVFLGFICFIAGAAFMRYQWPKDPEIRQILQYQYEKFKEKQKAKTKAEEIAERERILQEKKLAEEKAAREERERLRQEEKKAQAFLKRISQEIYNVTAQQKTLGTKRDGSSLIYPIPEVSKTPGWLSIADKWKAKQDTLFYVLTDDYMILVRNTKSCDACLKDLENSQ